MKKLTVIGILLAAGYVIASLLLYIFQEDIIFLGTELPDDYSYSFTSNFKEINLETPDGGILNVLHFKNDQPKGIIIYFHGNAGDLSRWGTVAESFLPFGYDVAIMDYRGYGKSKGKRTQKTMLNDGLAFYDYFNPNFKEDNIIIYGRSIGTGIASYVASERKPGKLILETPYYNLTSLVQSKVPVFPAGPALRFKFRTNQYMKGVDCPIYIFHGTDDSVVPYKHGKRLFNSLDPGKARLITIEGGEHNDLDNYDQFWAEMEEALK